MTNQPLAELLRPKSINDIIGQEHLLNSNGLLRKMVINHKLSSLIFYGLPGTGKTSMAIALCNDLKLPYQIFNTVVDDKAKLKQIIDTAMQSHSNYVLICEEIHRLNRDKQDILLPYLEKGIITLIACTTENPYFVINPAIKSRCQILEFKPIHSKEIVERLKQLVNKKIIQVKLTDDQLEKISSATNGDFRSVINIIDLINSLYKNQKITDSILEQFINGKYLMSSHYGDQHYDLLSAFHKSIRGSDPDAAIYYLGQLVLAKDFVSLNRRIIACCYEDIGLANPQLCDRVVNAISAANIVGFPECKQIYADIVIEMALSPKSNSGYMALNAALEDINHGKIFSIPNHIKDQSYASAYKLNHTGYKYPHDFGGYIDQQYLPSQLLNKKYYFPKSNEIESRLNVWLEQKRSKK